MLLLIRYIWVLHWTGRDEKYFVLGSAGLLRAGLSIRESCRCPPASLSSCGYLEGYFGGRFVTTLAVVVVSSFGQWPDHPESASSFGNFQLCNWSRLTVDRTLLLHIIELLRDLH